MPAHLRVDVDRFHRTVDERVDLLLAQESLLLPGEDLRILHEQPPERDKRAVAAGRPRLVQRALHPLLQRDVALLGARHINALVVDRCPSSDPCGVGP